VPAFLIIDDHEVARRGIRQVLSDGFPGSVFAEAPEAISAVDLLGSRPWDLVLLDLNLPGRGGLDLLSEVKRLTPGSRTLVVSAFGENEFALRCIRMGADGYVTKTSGARELLQAVERVLEGGKFVTPVVAERLAVAAAGRAKDDSIERLTTRELQVLRLLARGRSMREVAHEMNLAEKTVATHRARIGAKLGLSTNVEITRYALLHGLAD
jgi:DNA-binding NarL/FixJ family response regulator